MMERSAHVDWELFASDLRAHRARLRVDLRTAARCLGTSASTLSRTEGGKPCEVDLLMRLLIWMKADAWDYVDWDAAD